jgi:hypothetical protein
LFHDEAGQPETVGNLLQVSPVLLGLRENLVDVSLDLPRVMPLRSRRHVGTDN